MTTAAHLITALVTPLREDDSLHTPALQTVLARQIDAGIDGLLIAGSMGVMQLLPDATYADLVREATAAAAGRAEILIGAGDTAFGRTRDRIRFLNDFAIDGVVVLAPYLIPFTQAELIDYFRALAEESRAPLFLYDLPQMTRTKLAQETVLTLARHPNIAGIKCSDEPGYARRVRDLAPERFRIILSAPSLLDVFLRSGFLEHLDGVFTLCPRQAAALSQTAMAGDHYRAAVLQEGINRLLGLLHKDGVWNPFTALLHAQGIDGRFKPRPHQYWDAETESRWLEEAETRETLAFLDAATETSQEVRRG